MWFWWFIFICDLLIPLSMIICGRILWKHPPQSINGLIGYQTARSMKNINTWRFAQTYCGQLWWKIGWILLIPSFLIHLPFYNSSEDTIGALGGILCLVQCIVIVLSILLVEKALKTHFTEEGVQKNHTLSNEDRPL